MLFKLYSICEFGVKEQPEAIIKILNCESLESCLKVAIETLVADLGCYMGSMLNLLDNINCKNNLKDGLVYFKHIYHRLFQNIKRNDQEFYRKFTYFQQYKIIIAQYPVTYKDLKDAFQNLKIFYFYELLGVQKSKKVVKIDYTGIEFQASIIEKSYINDIKEIGKFNNPGVLKMLNDELIKFFWALGYKEYKNKKWSQMHTNAFFGLFYTRMPRKTLDKINCTKQLLKCK